MSNIVIPIQTDNGTKLIEHLQNLKKQITA